MRDARRNFLKGVAGAVGGWASLEAATRAEADSKPMTTMRNDPTVRDKFWIWGHVAGSYNNQWGLPRTSRMTPAEAAFYLGVPNLIMVSYPADPKDGCKMMPEPSEYDEYAISFRPLKRVLWSIVGAGGRVMPKNLDLIRQLAQKFPNIVGAYMDDFFRDALGGGRVGVLTPNEIAYLHNQLGGGARKLELWVTLYRHDLKANVSEYLDHVDVVTYWTWKAQNLDNLEQDFAQAEKAAPHARKVLGCYMWDFGTSKPMPIAAMQKQCRLGLQWLKAGRIDGMIFLASPLCDLGLETVQWTRHWIAEVGDEELQRA